MTEYLDRYPTMHEYAEGKRINPKLTDLISRADAIEALSRSSVYAWSIEQDLVAHSWAIRILQSLPSADAVWEKENDGLNTCNNNNNNADADYKSHGMSDYISRADAIDAVVNAHPMAEVEKGSSKQVFWVRVSDVAKALKALPSADAEWIPCSR